MTFGTGELVPGVTNTIDQASANDLVALALDHGVNLFDTADMYTGGQSEEILGRALRGRSDVLVSTKSGFRSGESLNDRGASARYLHRAVDASLKRLGTSCIDLYFLHIPDPWTPIDETLRALEDLTRAGKLRAVGLSNFPAWLAQKMLGQQDQYGWTRLQVLQMYYSLLGRDIEHEVVPLLQDAELALMTWSPLASGYLTGKYASGKDAGGRRKNFQFPPLDTELGDRVVAELSAIAAEHRADPAQVALSWQLTKPFVTSVIVGATSKQQLTQNLAAADLLLTAEQSAKLDALTAPTAPYPAWMRPMAMDAKTQAALQQTRQGLPEG